MEMINALGRRKSAIARIYVTEEVLVKLPLIRETLRNTSPLPSCSSLLSSPSRSSMLLKSMTSR